MNKPQGTVLNMSQKTKRVTSTEKVEKLYVRMAPKVKASLEKAAQECGVSMSYYASSLIANNLGYSDLKLPEPSHEKKNIKSRVG